MKIVCYFVILNKHILECRSIPSLFLPEMPLDLTAVLQCLSVLLLTIRLTIFVLIHIDPF
jgi:hypothetical protein